MRPKTLSALLLTTLFAVLAGVSGCKNEVKTIIKNPDPPVVDPGPAFHVEGWMVKSSPEFHGVQADSVALCAECHQLMGRDGSGGVGCIDCHNQNFLGCTGCHGGTDNKTGAPPMSLRGETSRGVTGVGAHTAHLTDTTFSRAIACGTCHRVPAVMASPGHMDDDSVAELTFASLAGIAASWDHASATCNNIHCHGAFVGGSQANPLWTGTTDIVCGDCHAVTSNYASLGWKHAEHVESGLTCVECHWQVVTAQNQIVNRSLHINGLVEATPRDATLCGVCHGPGGTFNCTGCHGGDDNQTGAPPNGLRGETARSTRAVGAHTVHLTGSGVSDGAPCATCHTAPASINSPGHIATDSTAEITWSSLAGAQAAWNRTNNTCSNTYCHGNFPGGNTTTPIWTSSNAVACGSCHDAGADPSRLSGNHGTHDDEGIACRACHNGTVNSQLAIIGPAVHVDGQKTVQFVGAGSIDANKNCSDVPCHDTKNWFEN